MPATSSFQDRVLETWAGTGTGNVTPAGAASAAYVTFASVFVADDRFYYVIQSATEFEVGFGSWNGTQVIRNQVLKSSNANALVSFLAGTKYIFVDYPGRSMVPQGNVAAIGGLRTRR